MDSRPNFSWRVQLPGMFYLHETLCVVCRPFHWGQFPSAFFNIYGLSVAHSGCYHRASPSLSSRLVQRRLHGQAFLCLPTVAQHCILGVVAGPELAFLTLDLSPPHAPLPQLPLPKPGLAQVLGQNPLPLNTDLTLLCLPPTALELSSPFSQTVLPTLCPSALYLAPLHSYSTAFGHSSMGLSPTSSLLVEPRCQARLPARHRHA